MEKERNLGIFFFLLSFAAQIRWSCNLIHPEWDEVRAKLMKYVPLSKLMISDGIMQMLFVIDINKQT